MAAIPWRHARRPNQFGQFVAAGQRRIGGSCQARPTRQLPVYILERQQRSRFGYYGRRYLHQSRCQREMDLYRQIRSIPCERESVRAKLMRQTEPAAPNGVYPEAEAALASAANSTGQPLPANLKRRFEQ